MFTLITAYYAIYNTICNIHSRTQTAVAPIGTSDESFN